MKSGDRSINIAELDNGVTELKTKDCTLNGLKTFGSFPCCKNQTYPPENISKYGSADNVIPNVRVVNDLIQSSPIYMSTDDSFINEGSPFTIDQNGSPVCRYDDTVGKDKFYYWKIDDNGTDSSESIVENTSLTRLPYQQMKRSGNLVIYGWLADRGAVDPVNCWVGLFAFLKTGQTTSQWVPVSIKPWIRGINASVLQYVGFNIPVKKGLRLKIKTGFNVNGKTSDFQYSQSLTFRDKWVPNSFVGYLISNS